MCQPLPAPPSPAGLAAARRQFVDLWGQMSLHWGINRTMAMIHALLMVAHEPLTAEQIMTELSISRGNASMNLRELINWGIVRRTNLPRDRRDFYAADSDVWTTFQIILRERKKRELDPLVTRLEQCATLAGRKPGASAPARDKAAFAAYMKRVTELRDFFGTFHRVFGALLDNEPGGLAKAIKVIDKLV
jgi:DNA-binding transcriptional regulator GbsR (MarR family)